MHELGRIERAEYDEKCREIDGQRSRVAAPPAPLFAQQQQALTTLVDERDAMTADERKRMLAAIFDRSRRAPREWTGWSHARTGSPTSRWPSLSL